MALNKFINKEIIGNVTNVLRKAGIDGVDANYTKNFLEGLSLDSLSEKQVTTLLSDDAWIRAKAGVMNVPSQSDVVQLEKTGEMLQKLDPVQSGPRAGMMRKDYINDMKADYKARAAQRESVRQNQQIYNDAAGIPNEQDRDLNNYRRKREIIETVRADDETKAQEAAASRAEEMEKANRGWRQRTLDGTKERVAGIWDNVKDTVSGANRQETTRRRREHNQQVLDNGGSDFITSNREFKRMERKYADSNADTPGSLYENMMKAEETATGAKDYSGIYDFVHQNQLLVAGGIAGTAVLGAAILDSSDDDDY